MLLIHCLHRVLASFDALFLAMAILVFGLPKIWPWYSHEVYPNFVAVAFGLMHTFR